MRFFHPVEVERYLRDMLYNDRDTIQIVNYWELEREEIFQIVLKHFHEMGIFSVHPKEEEALFRSVLHEFLHHSPFLKKRLFEVRAQIERAKSRSRGHE